MSNRLQDQMFSTYKQMFESQAANGKKKVLNLDKLKAQVKGITVNSNETGEVKQEFEATKNETLKFIDEWKTQRNNNSSLVEGGKVADFLFFAS